ncbi:MAG: bifunctional enoyl-CoA hydratase/phosphate acetyltransferase [Bacteroidales bacterium]|nr:bifunctional enoyl-CoA hydratase/phosphate acetyltransferase [Bacteroidales bacterium]
MIKKIEDLYHLAKNQTKKKKLVLAVAQDEHSFDAVYKAYKNQIIDMILVGDAQQINDIASKKNIIIPENLIIDIKDKDAAVKEAVSLARKGQADILMKGNVPTATLLRAVLNKEWGLKKSKVLSHFVLFEIPNYHKLLGLTDVAMNIAPDLDAKIGILNNAVPFMNKIGIKIPKVAPIAAVEVINTVMQPTIDAAALSKMSDRGQIPNCIIDGPLAFDNAISKESAEHKGIKSEVAGDADLLLVPYLEAGNILYKTLTYFANARLAAVILGAKVPIVLTSRSDSEDAKLNSIMLASLG